MKPQPELLKPRYFGDIFTDTFVFLRTNLKAYAQVFLFLVVPILVIASYFFSFYFSAITEMMNNRFMSSSRNPITSSLGPIAIGYIGFILASIFQHLALIQTFLKHEKAEAFEVDASSIFDGVKRDILRFFGFNVVVFLLAAVVFVLIGFVFAGLIAANAVGVVLMLVLVLIVAMVYILTSLSFAPFIYLREDVGVFDALSRSFQLIKGSWWETFGVIFVMFIIMYFAAMIFSIPFYIVFFVNMMHSVQGSGAMESNSILTSIGVAIMSVGSSFCSSILYASIGVQYYSLVEKKEGQNLMQQIENIDAPETPSY